MSETPQQEPIAAYRGTGALPVMPTTKLGKWAIGLSAVFIVAMAVNMLVFMPLWAWDQSPIPAWRQWLLPIFGIAMMATGFAGGLLGMLAVVLKKERSLLVFATLVPTAFVTVFVLGEILIPH